MSVKLLKMNVKNKILYLPKDTFHILHNTNWIDDKLCIKILNNDAIGNIILMIIEKIKIRILQNKKQYIT